MADNRQMYSLFDNQNETRSANNRRSVDPPKTRTVVEKVSKAQLESIKNKKGAQYKVDGNLKVERVESTKGTVNLKFKEGYYVEHTIGPVKKLPSAMVLVVDIIMMGLKIILIVILTNIS